MEGGCDGMIKSLTWLPGVLLGGMCYSDVVPDVGGCIGVIGSCIGVIGNFWKIQLKAKGVLAYCLAEWL